MIINTMSCIYAQNGVQNTFSFIYVYAETKINSIENIHVEPVAATKNPDIHLVANTTTIFNANQVYVADNSYIYFNGFINATENTIYVAEKSFIAKKLPKKPNKDCVATPKTKSKTTTSFKTFPPFSNSPIGFFKGGFNVLVLTQSFQNSKTTKGLIYPKTTNYTPLLVEYFSPCGAKVPQDVEICNNHYCKYTFSLPPPVFC